MSDISVNIKVNNESATASLRQMQKELKDLISQQQNVAQGTKEWDKLAKAINQTEGKIGDLKDSFQTLKGSGVERLNASMGLLTDGFRNFDTDKIKIGFKGLGAAMSAVPVFLLVQGFQLLVENWDKVVAFGKQVIGSFNEQESSVRKLTKELENQKAVTATLSKELNRQIAEMEASGASHDKIIKAKQALIKTQIEEAVITAKLNIAKAKEVQSNDSIYESYLRTTAAALKKIGADEKAEEIEKQIAFNKNERNKENVKSVNESIELIKDLQSKAKVEEINNEKEKKNEAIKAAKEKNDRLIELEKELSEAKIAGAEVDKANREMIAKDLKAEKDAEDAEKLNRLNNQLAMDQAAYDADVKARDEANKKKKESDAAVEDSKQRALAVTQSLADAIGSIALARAKGNAQKEIEIRKQMFNIDKAFNIARAVQDGVRSVQAALTIPPPGGQILAGLNAAAAAANVLKIAATKFDGGNISVSTGSVGSIPNIPNSSQNPAANPIPQSQRSTEFNDDGTRKEPVIGLVKVSEINDTQSAIIKVKQQAKY